jgi:16S rRNA (guanine(966)-N(2))-methyltransferase RsmD
MRIIAGLYKGRDLLSPPGESSTRPITGSVKKSLFAMLGEDLSGQRVLDLFCGTGTLGIEALSRGAEHCCFAERDPAVIARLARNLQDCRATAQAVIWRGDVESRLAQWLGELTAPVDVAFVDPPYALAQQWDWAQASRNIFDPLTAKLAPDGIVVLRTDDQAQPPPSLGLLAEVRTRTYGNMVIRLLKRIASPQVTQ